MASTTIALQSSDGEKFDVPKEIARKSVTIKTMLEDLGLDDDDSNCEAVPLPNVVGSVLKKVIEWCEKHKDEPTPTQEEEEKDLNPESLDQIPKWDEDFFNVDQALVFELILAANYLDIKGLLNLGCKIVAKMIRGKTPEEIRKHFNIKNDFTPEEEEKIRKENEWCNEK